ncbi:unnamed protein product [Rhizophagus irregularis]|nr:unnamed protein product [Rhizophagus irregularis]
MELTEDQLEPNYITLKEEENEELEIVLRRVSGRNLETPGKEAIKTLPQKEPKPPLVECGNGKYRGEASRSSQISDTIKLHKSNASRLAERQDS